MGKGDVSTLESKAFSVSCCIVLLFAMCLTVCVPNMVNRLFT